MVGIKTNISALSTTIGQRLATLYPGGKNRDTVMRTLSTSMLGVVKTRIHEEGKATDGTLIGVYSKKPLYISIKANAGRSFGAPVGKTGKSKTKAGKPHTSKYYPQGYYQFKTEIGRNQLGTVNLSLSGQLNSQLTIRATERGYGIGWNDAEKLRRARFLERKYKKRIWSLSKEERDLALAIAQRLISNAILK